MWFKAKVGLEVDEIPRDDSFCAYAILRSDVLTSDPMVTSISLAAFTGARRPCPRRTHSDPGRSRIGAGGLPTHPRLLLDAPQWPSEAPQGNHLLLFRSAQDVAHIDEGYRALRRIQRPRALSPLAGFG